MKSLRHSRARAATPRTHRAVRVSAALFMANPKTDASAQLLSQAIKFALQTRLKTHASIDVSVESNALDLMAGKFGGMTVSGTHWRTPKQLTAQRIQVSVGELQVDQSALLFQQRVALKNIPLGYCTLVLTPQDLGNFMVHDLMKGPASKAIKGHSFAFDPATVAYTRTGTTTGRVLYEGISAISGKPRVYEVAMEAVVQTHAPGRASHQHQHGHGRRHASPPPPLRVHARHLRRAPHSHPHTHRTHPASGRSQHAHSTAAGHAPAAVVTEAAASTEHDAEPHLEEVVGEQLNKLFNSLTLDLQGVELAAPRLRLLDASSAAAAAGKAPELLEIHAQLRLVSLPPLNMQF